MLEASLCERPAQSKSTPGNWAVVLIAGGNSYRNLAACCLQCNSQKGERSAIDHLRRLYRERPLSDAELTGRLRALDALAAGKLRPRLAS